MLNFNCRLSQKCKKCNRWLAWSGRESSAALCSVPFMKVLLFGARALHGCTANQRKKGERPKEPYRGIVMDLRSTPQQPSSLLHYLTALAGAHAIGFSQSSDLQFQSLAGRLSSAHSWASPRKRRRPVESRKGGGRSEAWRIWYSAAEAYACFMSRCNATTPLRGCRMQVRTRLSTGAPRAARNRKCSIGSQTEVYQSNSQAAPTAL